MSSFRAVIFDLDGTLVDSAVSIAAALDRVRLRRGANTPLAVEHVRQWVSLGADQLVRNALENMSRDAKADLAEFRTEYAALTTSPVHLYDGVTATLDILADAGFRLAVCSNKPQALCLRVLEDTGIRDRFDVVLGGDAVPQSKPYPAHLLAAVSALSTVPSEAPY